MHICRLFAVPPHWCHLKAAHPSLGVVWSRWEMYQVPLTVYRSHHRVVPGNMIYAVLGFMRHKTDTSGTLRPGYILLAKPACIITAQVQVGIHIYTACADHIRCWLEIPNGHCLQKIQPQCRGPPYWRLLQKEQDRLNSMDRFVCVSQLQLITCGFCATAALNAPALVSKNSFSNWKFRYPALRPSGWRFRLFHVLMNQTGDLLLPVRV